MKRQKMEITKKCTTAFENITKNFYQNSHEFPLAIINHRKPLIVGIGGGLGSGKTTFCENVLSKIGAKQTTLLLMNLFYKDLTPEEKEFIEKNEYNFYCPQAFDFDLIYKILFQLKNGKSAAFKKYNFQTHKREMPIQIRGGAEVVILEGMFVFCDQRCRDLMDFKLFIDTDPDVCLLRYIIPEDSDESNIEDIKDTYTRYIKPAIEQYILPSSKYADLNIKFNDEKSKVIEIISNAIKMELIKDEIFAKRLKVSTITELFNDPLSPSFNLVKEAPEIGGAVQTLSANNERNKTAYYLEQLMRKLFQYVVNQICYEDVEIRLPTGEIYNGKRQKFAIHGMIIIRSQTDQNLINTFRFSLKCHPVGTILINTNSPASKPNICFHNLPLKNENQKIILLDSTVTAGSCLKAVIHRLCEDIPGKKDGYKFFEEDIIVCTVAMTELGIKRISHTFPRITFYTPFLDSEIIQNLYNNSDDDLFDVEDYNICHEE